jgi:hypothetical protein
MVLRQRFSIIDVDRRDDLAGLNGGEESGFVDQRASRRIDQDRALFHASNILGADEIEATREKAAAELARRARNPRDLISVPKILWRQAIDRSRRAMKAGA